MDTSPKERGAGLEREELERERDWLAGEVDGLKAVALSLRTERDEARAEVERLKQECADLADNAMKSIAAHDAVDLARLKEIQDLYRELRDEKAAVEAMADAIEKHLPGVHPVQSPDEGIHLLAEQRDAARAQSEADWNACCDALAWSRSFGKDLPPPSRAVAAVLEELAKARGASGC